MVEDLTGACILLSASQLLVLGGALKLYLSITLYLEKKPSSAEHHEHDEALETLADSTSSNRMHNYAL